jgi:REP element-mobilizing transposase RayT
MNAMARPTRIEYPGAVYHVICRGNNRQAIYRDDQDRRRYLEKLSYYCQDKKVDLLAYCLLSNHVHLLLETPEGNLSKMMQAFQTSYTVYFNKRHGRTGHVFEQRYKAMLVDKDNYLLQVSRYIHLNALSAKLAERAQNYRWCSYGSYLKGKGIPGLKTETVLGQLNGSKTRKLQQYREYVEGGRGEQPGNPAPEVRQQIYVGDEEFVEAMQTSKKASLTTERRHSLQRIINSVSAVTGVGETEMRQRQRGEAVKASREMLCYVARHHGQVRMSELAKVLQVKETSTPSHAVRRAEERLKVEPSFRRLLDQVMQKLD